MTTVEKFKSALARLDRCATADEVRQLLIVNDVTGTPGNCHTCPVARYLTQVIGVESGWIWIDQEKAELWNHNPTTGVWKLVTERVTPNAARYFIFYFDGLESEPSDDVDVSLRPYLPLLDRGDR